MHTGEAPRAAGRMRGLPGSGERAASGTENKGAAKKGKAEVSAGEGGICHVFGTPPRSFPEVMIPRLPPECAGGRRSRLTEPAAGRISVLFFRGGFLKAGMFRLVRFDASCPLSYDPPPHVPYCAFRPGLAAALPGFPRGHFDGEMPCGVEQARLRRKRETCGPEIGSGRRCFP